MCEVSVAVDVWFPGKPAGGRQEQLMRKEGTQNCDVWEGRLLPSHSSAFCQPQGTMEVREPFQNPVASVASFCYGFTLMLACSYYKILSRYDGHLPGCSLCILGPSAIPSSL